MSPAFTFIPSKTIFACITISIWHFTTRNVTPYWTFSGTICWEISCCTSNARPCLFITKSMVAVQWTTTFAFVTKEPRFTWHTVSHCSVTSVRTVFWTFVKAITSIPTYLTRVTTSIAVTAIIRICKLTVSFTYTLWAIPTV
jgi:hypothetical protein